MQLNAHDLRMLQLAAQDVEGRLRFHIAEDGSIAVAGKGEAQPLHANGALSRLEKLGLFNRALGRAYVLTPEGWDVTKVLAGGAG